MAITGTGTKTNPYIPTTWEDFLKCTTEDIVYTTLPEGGGTFDMKDYYPDGKLSYIPLKGFINGNNWVIKNVQVINETNTDGVYGFNTSSNAYHGYVSNLNFSNFNLDANGVNYNGNGNGTVMLIREGGNPSSPVVLNCRFSGTLLSNTSGSYPVVIGNGSYNSIIKNCSFNLICRGHSSVNGGWNWRSELLRCNIKVKTLDKENNPEFYAGFNCCYIQGDFAKFYTFTSSGVDSTTSILNADVSNSVLSGAGSPNDFIVNTDKYSGSIPYGYIGVTTEQLKDKDYLNSVGFIISENPADIDGWHMDPSINGGIPYIPSMISLLPDPGEEESFSNCYLGEEKIKGIYIGEEKVKTLYIGDKKI